MRPSTTKLSEILCNTKLKSSGLPVASKTFTAKELKDGLRGLLHEGFSISDETYGRDSRLYIRCPSHSIRRALEARLRSKGVTTVNESYWPSSNTVEVGVTFFKGWHYDV